MTTDNSPDLRYKNRWMLVRSLGDFHFAARGGDKAFYPAKGRSDFCKFIHGAKDRRRLDEFKVGSRFLDEIIYSDDKNDLIFFWGEINGIMHEPSRLLNSMWIRYRGAKLVWDEAREKVSTAFIRSWVDIQCHSSESVFFCNSRGITIILIMASNCLLSTHRQYQRNVTVLEGLTSKSPTKHSFIHSQLIFSSG